MAEEERKALRPVNSNSAMYTLGIDIGSTTSKCAVIKDGTELVDTSLQTGGLGTGGPEEALAALWRSSGLTAADIARTEVTGYGRKNYEVQYPIPYMPTDMP